MHVLRMMFHVNGEECVYTENSKVVACIYICLHEISKLAIFVRLNVIGNLPIYFLLFHNLPMGDSISNSSNVTLTKCNGEKVDTTRSTQAASEIVGAQVGKRKVNVSSLNASLSNPIHLNFSFDMVVNGSNYRCAYWNFSDP